MKIPDVKLWDFCIFKYFVAYLQIENVFLGMNPNRIEICFKYNICETVGLCLYRKGDVLETIFYRYGWSSC